jgi:hypothetical protein
MATEDAGACRAHSPYRSAELSIVIGAIVKTFDDEDIAQ